MASLTSSRSGELRMTEGPIGRKIIAFAIPLFLGNLFQQLYNTADTLIVGRLLGDSALAAVASSGSLLFLIVGFFGGIAMGAGVVMAQYFGAEDNENLSASAHTLLTTAFLAGLFLTVFGTLLAPQILIWMDTPPEVLDQSTAYVRVYFMGVMGMVMYNACMGIMQAVGDAKHPLYYLIFSSCLNIVLDIVFIAVFDLGVASAAAATVIAQFSSVALCLFRLMRIDAPYRIRLSGLGIRWDILVRIVRYGLPSGFANSVIALANVIVQSNINAFGEMAMAGCGAYAKIEGFAFLPITCFTSAITTFVGQNLGAEEYDRTRAGARFGVLTAMGIAQTIGIIIFIAAPLLIGAFATGTEAIAFGVEKSRTCALFNFLLAASHCLAAVMRGAGRATVPMTVMLVCWCIIRVAILSVVTPLVNDIWIVNWVYPMTWTLSTAALGVYYFRVDWMKTEEKAAKSS